MSVVTRGVSRERSSDLTPLPRHNISRISYHARRRAAESSGKTQVLRLGKIGSTQPTYPLGVRLPKLAVLVGAAVLVQVYQSRLYCSILHYIISYHIISYRIISYHLITYPELAGLVGAAVLVRVHALGQAPVGCVQVLRVKPSESQTLSSWILGRNRVITHNEKLNSQINVDLTRS